MTPRRAAAGTCASCGSSLWRGQRYCVECGERVGSRSPQLLALLRRAARADGAVGGAEGLPAEAAPSPQAPGGATRTRVGAGALLAAAGARVGALRLPSPRVSALLVIAFVGFGALLGSAASSRVDDTLAASARAPLKLVLPPAADSAKSTAGESSTSSEPPPAEPEATPEAPAAEAAAPASTTPASTTTAPASNSGEGASKGGGEEGGSKPSSTPKLPAVKHVFVIMLSDEPYAAAFGPESSAPYLAKTLERRGELLVRYYAVAHQQLSDAIALLSGQGPTQATAANCPTYAAVTPGTQGGEGQTLGEGCVYPATTPTLLGQLEVRHLSWRAYVQGIDEPGASAPACAHPALGQPDPTVASPPPAQPYATFRNPIVYFQGLTEAPSCASDDVGLSSLGADVSSAKRTPSLSYIVPDRCHDGSPGPCPGGGVGGLGAADGFLEQVVPKILASKAYRESGLLVITTDEAPTSGEFADSSSCCGQPRFPNLPAPSGPTAGLAPEGGGQVGALLLSPFVKPGTTSQEPYNHYSLLRTIEDLFALKHVGYAGAPHVTSLEPSLFTAPAGR